MDTRTKITTVEAAAGRDIQWVAGYFDPLLADHVRQLRKFHRDGKELGVIVRNPPQPLLPQRARAELVAALAMVKYVVLDAPRVEAASLDDLGVRDALCRQIIEREREA